MPLNWQEVSKSVKEGERQRSGGARRLYIQDGESVDIRLLGGDNEPFIYKRHYDGKTGRYLPCAEDHAKAGDHPGCVACALARSVRGEGKTARIKSPQRVYVVSVFDPRKFHYVESRPKGEQYVPCPEDETCRYCRKGLDRKINGVRYWEMAENLITQLQQFEISTLGKRCGRCKTGKIKVTGYICPVCEETLEPDDPNEDTRCVSCEKESGKKHVEVRAKEQVSCITKCGNKGRRITLADAWLTVSVSGKKQSKTWNFNVGDVEPFDPDTFLKDFPDLKKIGALPLSEMPDFQPVSAAEQAAILGVPNPFGKGGGKAEDDDDDDPPRRKKRPVDEDDEDEAPPKKKKGLMDEAFEEEDDAPKRKKKPPVEDDEDDEEIF